NPGGDWALGTLDEVAVYPNALNLTQVTNHFGASGNTRPTAPGTVAASGGSNQATITWTAASAAGSAISHYTITAFKGALSQNATAVPASATQATISGLQGN